MTTYSKETFTSFADYLKHINETISTDLKLPTSCTHKLLGKGQITDARVSDASNAVFVSLFNLLLAQRLLLIT